MKHRGRTLLIGRVLAGLGLLALIGLSAIPPASADDPQALARALSDTPFDASQLGQGYRWVETITGDVPPDVAEAGVVAGAMAGFQGDHEMFRDVATFYFIFGTAKEAEEYHEYAILLLMTADKGLNRDYSFFVELDGGPTLDGHCFLSASAGAISCTYLEPTLKTVIQILSTPAPTYDESIGKEGLGDAFLKGEGPEMLSAILPAARSHLLRVAGK